MAAIPIDHEANVHGYPDAMAPSCWKNAYMDDPEPMRPMAISTACSLIQPFIYAPTAGTSDAGRSAASFDIAAESRAVIMRECLRSGVDSR